jgi:hypothetical protein
VICPKCKANRAHRSHRRGFWEHLASFFAYYPHRCRACNYRFMRFKYASSRPSDAEPSHTEREIRATRSAIRWKRKKQEFVLYAIGLLVFFVFLYFVTRTS